MSDSPTPKRPTAPQVAAELRQFDELTRRRLRGIKIQLGKLGGEVERLDGEGRNDRESHNRLADAVTRLVDDVKELRGDLKEWIRANSKNLLDDKNWWQRNMTWLAVTTAIGVTSAAGGWLLSQVSNRSEAKSTAPSRATAPSAPSVR